MPDPRPDIDPRPSPEIIPQPEPPQPQPVDPYPQPPNEAPPSDPPLEPPPSYPQEFPAETGHGHHHGYESVPHPPPAIGPPLSNVEYPHTDHQEQEGYDLPPEPLHDWNP